MFGVSVLDVPSQPGSTGLALGDVEVTSGLRQALSGFPPSRLELEEACHLQSPEARLQLVRAATTCTDFPCSKSIKCRSHPGGHTAQNLNCWPSSIDFRLVVSAPIIVQ